MTAPLPPPRSDRSASRAPPAEPARGFVLERGLVIGKKYALERPAGFGGMAALWVATNQATGAEVCVKLLVPDEETGAHDEEAVARFRREAHAAAGLSHRAIVRVFDLLELDVAGEIAAAGAPPYAHAIVMELLHGETLGDLLAKRGKLPLEEALDLFLPVLSALGHAHRASVIHRDLKPDNIFLAAEPDGHVIPKVLDFGVSKLATASAITVDGILVGTPSFMSPEQARGARHIDARSDVFSAGTLLYMMLTGENPFDAAPTFASVVEAVARREVAPIPELTPAIASVIDRAMKKDPALRFGDATEMAIALRAAAGRRSTTDAGAGAPPALAPTLAADVRNAPAARSSRPSGPEGADGARIAPWSEEAARRRRFVVAAVVGAAAAVILTAAIAMIVRWAKAPAAEDAPSGARAATAEAAAASASATTAGSGASSSPAAGQADPSAIEPAAERDAATPSAAETDESAAARAAATAGRATARGAPAQVSASGAAAPPRATTTPRAPAAAGRGATSSAPPARKAGEEPHNARDPGF